MPSRRRRDTRWGPPPTPAGNSRAGRTTRHAGAGALPTSPAVRVSTSKLILNQSAASAFGREVISPVIALQSLFTTATRRAKPTVFLLSASHNVPWASRPSARARRPSHGDQTLIHESFLGTLAELVPPV